MTDSYLLINLRVISDSLRVLSSKDIYLFSLIAMIIFNISGFLFKQGCFISSQSDSGGMVKVNTMQTYFNSPFKNRTKDAAGYLISIDLAG